ncbi:MAG: metalloregulator ArsR/SmtB family transcription factor [Candidatus Omnitrophica bacterium]|nr:metalloregulator ArsR/SmtB family transcription factor [Candidatus Omnitrophota bacterium]MCM8806368.1 metalloregulator ArsR/SmtB family transcription factor [Candidatus Omnitrophota bacterium]
MEKYVEYLKAIGEPTRLRIVKLLLKAKVPLCVCEIMDCIKANQTNVSKHLKVLKYSKLIKERKEGKFVMYSIIKPKNDFLKHLFETLEKIPDKFFESDMKCLNERSLIIRKRWKMCNNKKC